MHPAVAGARAVRKDALAGGGQRADLAALLPGLGVAQTGAEEARGGGEEAARGARAADPSM